MSRRRKRQIRRTLETNSSTLFPDLRVSASRRSKRRPSRKCPAPPGPALGEAARFCSEPANPYVKPAGVVGPRADGPWQQLQASGGWRLDLDQLVAETDAAAISLNV